MKPLVPLSAVLLVACANDARLIDTYAPPVEEPAKVMPEGPELLPIKVGMRPPPEVSPLPVTASCSTDGWCLDGLDADGKPLTTRHLRAVFAHSADAAWAVGDYGTLLIWNGIEWRAFTGTRPADDLFAVWASGPTDVWVAGITGDPEQLQAMYAHFDGTQFDHLYKPLAKRPEGLFGFGPTNVWSVGTSGAMFRWTGQAVTWVAAPQVTSESLADVTGLAGKMWAVGSNGALLEHDGSAWVTMATPTPPVAIGGLAAIVAFSPTRLFAAGGADLLEYDGTTWKHERLPASLDAEILGLWGATPQRLWAVGTGGKAWKLEGARHSRSDTGVTRLLRDVHGVDEQHVWAVGFDGTVLRRYGP